MHRLEDLKIVSIHGLEDLNSFLCLEINLIILHIDMIFRSCCYEIKINKNKNFQQLYHNSFKTNIHPVYKEGKTEK
jgi:hypothetical protein